MCYDFIQSDVGLTGFKPVKGPQSFKEIKEQKKDVIEVREGTDALQEAAYVYVGVLGQEMEPRID